MKRLLGQTITLYPDDEEVTITEVGDYDPPDPSVGITGGAVEVTCSDGNSYTILDNGDVYLEGETSVRPHGHAAPLWDHFNDD